ncbi:MAG TPA: glycine cleavage system aminomethyltransferase GcvT [Pseudolabrys sp.]|jgi:aminomethyltransferase|nr:glycine cleavage system aminomethyltransferase GcvT [Pseudolabrys sp.]
MSATADIALKRTPLHALHTELGASMVPFAGYDMPVRYPAGILKEHLHTRAAAGLFDVSHMGQFEIRAKSGAVENAARALESLIPIDVIGLANGRQRYALLTNDEGGIRDDLMVANLGDRIVIVANAACKDADEAYLREALAETCELTRRDDRALLALQGPAAEDVLAQLCADVRAMRFLDVRACKLIGMDCVVSRSGYTGEDGFEISVPAEGAEALARKLLSNTNVAPIGLGARDSLRLEAGLCLYGSDLDTQTTPVEADLQWSIQASRKAGGRRSGGFPGAEIILDQLVNGAPRKRVGLRPEGRAPIRHGAQLFENADAKEPIGVVTSGGFGPSVNAPIAMGYVTAAVASAGTPVFAELRGERVPVAIAKMPFVANRYKR